MQSQQHQTRWWTSETVDYVLMFAALPLFLAVAYPLLMAVSSLADQMAIAFGINWTSSMYLIIGGFVIGMQAVRIKFFPDFGEPISREQMPEAWRSFWGLFPLLLVVVAGSEAVRWALGFY